MKKYLFGMGILIILSTSLSAQSVRIVFFDYEGIDDDRAFNARYSFNKRMFEGVEKAIPTTKLPNDVIRAIDNNLRRYSLDVGDVFTASLFYQEFAYIVLLQVTDAKNLRWHFYAWHR